MRLVPASQLPMPECLFQLYRNRVPDLMLRYGQDCSSVGINGDRRGTFIWDSNPMDRWQNIANFQVGWSNIGSARLAPGDYRKDPITGQINLRGYLTGGSNNLSIFILPDGYRPKYYCSFVVPAYDGTTRSFAIIDINPEGAVTAYNYNMLNKSGAFLELSAVSFSN
jgi:hypothetical protein